MNGKRTSLSRRQPRNRLGRFDGGRVNVDEVPRPRQLQGPVRRRGHDQPGTLTVHRKRRSQARLAAARRATAGTEDTRGGTPATWAPSAATVGSGSVRSGRRAQRAGWCQQSAWPVLSRCARMPARIRRASSGRLSPDAPTRLSHRAGSTGSRGTTSRLTRTPSKRPKRSRRCSLGALVAAVGQRWSGALQARSAPALSNVSTLIADTRSLRCENLAKHAVYGRKVAVRPVFARPSGS